jgi:thiol-disulfide isomerase/thioredoxin
MDNKFPLRASLLDLACGLLAFVVVVVTVFLPSRDPDIRPFIIVTFCSFFAAYWYRTRKLQGGTLLTGALVAMGGVGTALVLRGLRMALTDTTFMVCFLSAVGAAVALGFLLRLLIKGGHGRSAAALGFLSLAIVVVSAVILIPEWREQLAYRTVNRSVAPFSLRTQDGRTLTLENLKGHVVVLSFWATWCPPCQAELPQIGSVAKHYSADSRVVVLAVNTGTNGDTAEKAQAFLLKRQANVPWAMDSVDGSSDGPAAQSFGVTALPVFYILDARGTLRVIHSGFDASEDLRRSLSRQIDKLL